VSATIAVRVQARVRREEIVGMRAGALIVRVTAPPLEGRANRAVCALIAGAAGVPPSAVTIVRGETSRDKLVRVEGVEQDALMRALGYSS
jgi:uncharacterized protein (TIGR00251 family)